MGFLLHGKYHADHFDVTVKRSKEHFKPRMDDDAEMQKLCEHLLEELRREMAESPFRRQPPEPMRMGFGPPPVSK
jgi:hypothetical protein